MKMIDTNETMRPGFRTTPNMLDNRKTLAVFLTLMTFTLIGSACQDSKPLQLRYDVEKSLFEADKFRDRLLIRPDLISLEEKDSLRSLYRSVLNSALESSKLIDPQTNPQELKEISSLAFRIADRTRSIDFSLRDYDQARETLTILLQTVKLSRPEELITKVGLGRASQAAGDWPSARATFKEIAAEYYPPLSPTGRVIASALNLPYDIYRVERHLKVHPALGELADETESHYLGILESNFSANLNIATQALLSSFYQSEGRFDEALERLKFVVDSTGAQMFEAKLRGWDIQINNKGFYRPVLDELSQALSVNEDTLLGPVLHFKKAECYLGLNKYDSCRKELNLLKNEHKSFFYRNPMAQALVARSFQLAGKWNRAENEYRWLAETFPNTEEGFRSYLHILDHYRETRNSSLESTWSQRALDFYSENARRYPNSSIEATALSFQAEIHRRNQNWPAAAKALTQVATKFSESDVGRNSALGASIIYRQELADSIMADSMLTIYRSGFPSDNRSTQ